METVHLLISGKVHGVFFRATAKKVAQQLEITGWIKNTPKGEVEALITGEKEAIKAFIDWCKCGPDRALVKDIKSKVQPLTPFKAFTIMRF